MRIENRPNLHAAEEAQKHIDREDPSDRLVIIARKLVRTQIGVENTNGIHIPKPSRHSTERSKNHKPGPQTSLRIFNTVLSLTGGSNRSEIIAAVVGFFIFGVVGGLGTGGAKLGWRASFLGVEDSGCCLRRRDGV